MTRYTGSCHCGAVQFELQTDLTTALQCDCSLCKRKNAIMHRVPKKQFLLTKGKDALTLYQWNTRVAEHYFCKHCGIYTHHRPRTRPDSIAVNVGCIDDVNARVLEITFAEGSKLSGGR
jgi:hypothetical protein